MKLKVVLIAVVVLVFGSLTGCRNFARSFKSPDAETAAKSPGKLDIVLTTFDGKTIHLNQFKGKVVLIDFWATWCPPCRMEVPHLVDLYRQFHTKGLVIVGIDMDDNGKDVVKHFIEQFKVNYPIVLKNDSIIDAFGGIQGLPTKFILDKTGKIVDTRVGFQDIPKLFQEKIKPLL